MTVRAEDLATVKATMIVFWIKVDAFRLALAFDFQILETVPTEMYDVPMDGILTENGFYFCGDSQT